MNDLFLDLMHIPMVKQNETNEFVWYKIEIKIRKELKSYETKHGIIKFNKKNIVVNKDITTVIQFIRESTDESILANEDQILIRCFVKMNQCKRNNNFPECVTFASG